MSKIGEISGVEVYLSPQQYEEYKNSLEDEIERLNNIIKEVREYITSYESISIMQGLMKEYSNYDLDIKTMNEMIRRYMVVHDELLEILDKGE